MWKISKHYLLFVILIANFSLNAQLILTTSSEVDLKENSIEPTKVLRKVPAHKNVEFLDYAAFDKYNGMFKVKVYGITGFLNRNDVLYDNNFYLSLKASSKEISLNDTKVLSEIFDANKRKIAEEKLWAKQNGFQHEDYADLMSQMEKLVPVKIIVENTKTDPVKTQDYNENNIVKDEKGSNEINSSKGGYCMKSLTSNYSNSISSTLSPNMMNLINNEFVTLERFFNLDVTLKYSDGSPAYLPNSKTIVTGNDYINFDLNARQNSKYVNEVYKAVMAHEFAHALQDINGMFEYWSEGKQPELHADFLAGFYIGKNGLIAKDKLISFANEFVYLGDFDYFDPDHHGTPKERTCAFLEGYKVAVDYDFNIYQAYSVGIDYIKLLYPCDAFAIIREYSKTEYNNTNYTLPTGSYVFSSTQENMVFCNLYKQPLGEASPGKDLLFNNLTPGSYIVLPAKKLKSGKLKYYAPYTFNVKSNNKGQLTINKVGAFVIKTYSITF
jgi:hypothetical protein